MGPWTYYAPLWLGTLVSACLFFTVFRNTSEGLIWPFMIIIPLRSLGIGISLQLIMIGFQGILAKVVPVPVGRSIRGGVAQVVGGLLLGYEGIGWLAICFYFMSDLRSLTIVLFMVSGGCFTIALFVYLLNLSGASQDF